METICGIELSADDLKYAVVGHARHALTVTAHGRAALGRGLSPGNVLRRLVGERRIPARRIRIALGTQTTHMRISTFPAMPEADLLEVLKHEIRSELEVLPDEFTATHEILPREHPSAPFQVLLALTPRQGVAALERDLGEHGVHPERLTLGALALLAYARGGTAWRHGHGAFGILHLSSRMMILAIVQGETVRLVRDVGVGMSSSPWGRTPESESDEELSDPQDLDAIGRSLDEISRVSHQIRRTLEYDARSFPGMPPERLLLAGDVALAQELIPILQNDVRVPVEILDPLIGLEVPDGERELAQEGPAFALPLALAVVRDARRIPDLQSRPAAAGGKRAVSRATIGVWVAAAAVAATLGITRDRIDSLRGELGRLQTVKETLLGARSEEATPRQLLSDLGGWENAVPGFLLARLASHLPPEMVLTRISLARDPDGFVLHLEGRIESGHAKRRLEAWSELLDALGTDPLFTRIRLEPLEWDSGSCSDRQPFGIDLTASLP